VFHTCLIIACLARSEYDLADIYHNVADQATNPLLVGEDGYLVQRDVAKNMPSGTSLTTIANSTDRTAKSVKAGTAIACLGDDSVELLHKDCSAEQVRARYDAMRVPLRSVEIMTTNYYTFCSHDIYHDGGVPSWRHGNANKSIFRSLCGGHTLATVARLLKPNFSSPTMAADFAEHMSELSGLFCGDLTKDGCDIGDFDRDDFDATFVAASADNVCFEAS
jgi:hypothetical protein